MIVATGSVLRDETGGTRQRWELSNGPVCDGQSYKTCIGLFDSVNCVLIWETVVHYVGLKRVVDFSHEILTISITSGAPCHFSVPPVIWTTTYENAGRSWVLPQRSLKTR